MTKVNGLLTFPFQTPHNGLDKVAIDFVLNGGLIPPSFLL
jgi:hypothetical protein